MTQEWNKKIHVESSLPTKSGQFSLFIGRWQPLHDAHREMFNQVLKDGGNVCIAIRDIEPDYNNPYTPLEVLGKIMDEYKELIEQKRVCVMIVPDICSVNFGRGVGYSIIEHIPPQVVADISATKIRAELRKEGKL